MLILLLFLFCPHTACKFLLLYVQEVVTLQKIYLIYLHQK